MSGAKKRSISDFFGNGKKNKQNLADDSVDICESGETMIATSAEVVTCETETEDNTASLESSPTDIAKFPSDDLRQPVLKQFTQSKYGKDFRCFQADWYKTFPWIEYSSQSNSVFCFPCRMFSKSDSRAYKSVFVTVGYGNWKKALEKDSGFRKHENSFVHKSSQVSWDSYKFLKAKGVNISVATIIDEAYAAEVRENREYISSLADILRFTALQGIAQRGDDESSTSENKGNFLELLHFCAKKDPIVKKRIEDGPKNAKYVHPTIQN